MTDDLVKRLRKVEPDAPGERTRWYRNPDGPKAADRIEALEAALRDVLDRLVTAFPATEDYPPIKKARAALAGEKKE